MPRATLSREAVCKPCARAAQQREKQATLNDVLEKAGEAYRKHLKNAPRAIDYLKKRGLSGEIARQFGLGYAPEGWRNLASVFPDYDDPLLAESGEDPARSTGAVQSKSRSFVAIEKNPDIQGDRIWEGSALLR